MADLPGRISLREVGPRDGLQNEDPVPTAAKIALIDRLSGTGVGRIEAVSFVRPEAIPQMADADEVWQGIARTTSVRYSALAANLRGARRALDAGLTEIEVVVSASDTHNRKNVNRATAESLDDIAVIISEAHARGASCQVVVATAWGCPYEGDVPVARTVAVAGRAVADGADSISFGDTTGMATPRRVRELVGEFRSQHPAVPLNLHFHNTRGTGLANVLAALELCESGGRPGGLGRAVAGRLCVLPRRPRRSSRPGRPRWPPPCPRPCGRVPRWRCCRWPPARRGSRRARRPRRRSRPRPAPARPGRWPARCPGCCGSAG